MPPVKMRGDGRKAKNPKKTLLRLLGYMKKHTLTLIVVMACIVVNSVAQTRGSENLGILVDDYILPMVESGSGDFSALAVYLVKIAGVLALGIAASFLFQFLMVSVAQGTQKTVRDEMFAKMQRLPLRYFEFGTVYRHEMSGVVHGLLRARGFTQDDAHMFVRPDQLLEEFQKVIDIILYIFRTLKFDNYTAQISLRDKTNREKYIGTDENWEKAEQAIIRATEEKGLKTTIEYGEAAFYGPKLDFMVRDAIGRKWQLGTIQVDYNLPERFHLTYKGADDKLHRPIMIHRAPFGSMERFVAVLLEHTAGKFPLWLSPDQVAVLPISEKFNDYAEKVTDYLNRNDVRAQIDNRNEKIGRKIRDNELKRIPYLLIVGEKEQADGLVSVRVQGEGDKGQMTMEAFRDLILEKVKEETAGNDKVQ